MVISAALTGGDTLELRVWNNGNGLSDLSAPSDSSDKSHREGIGLKNVRSRLAQLYGGAQEFTLGNATGGGVEARIRIPCCTIPRSQAPRVVVMSETEATKAGLSLPTAASAKPKCC